MTKWIIRLAAFAILAALSRTGAGAPPPDKLAHDPFDRRMVQQLMREAEPPPAPSPAPAEEAPAAAAARAPVLTGKLRAVLVGGARPLVNLGGAILGIGDSAEGFRLVAVHERSAVFAKDGARVELALDHPRAP